MQLLLVCDCENCQECGAAYALHFDCSKSHFLASFDVELQLVVDGWRRLPKQMREAIAGLVANDM
jgi:hypothetical protein